MVDLTRTAAFATPVFFAAGSPTPPTPPPANVAGGGNWTSGTMPIGGNGAISASAELSQTGTLTIQRYIDAAGTIPIGAAITQAMTANTVATASVNDGLPAASFSVVVANTSGSTGNLTNVNVLTR